MRDALIMFLAAGIGPLHAAPLFTDRAGSLPAPAAVYDGGWTHFVGGGVAVMDCNGDRFPDIFVAGGANPARLFINETGGTGASLSFSEGRLDPITDTSGAYPLDIDSDGSLDLVVLRVGANLILRGDGACHFNDASETLGFRSGDHWTTAFSATWEEGQRLPTLAFGNYVDRADPDGPFEACDHNSLYRPEGGGYGAAASLVPGFCALSMLFSDWDRRGVADLRVSNDRHYYVRGGSEQMWRMDGPRLLTAEDGWKAVSIWGMGIASDDLDGDLRPDVMLTSMGDQLLQFGRDTGFEDAPYSMGTYATRPHLGDDGRPSTGWHAEFADVDNDGRDDLFIAKGNVDQMPGNAMRDPNNLLMQGPDGHFTEASVEAGIATTERARGAALSDLNRDGLLDLVVVNRRAPLELWENATPGAGHWLQVTPRQAGANGFAIGAWVELRLPGGDLRTREVTIGGGHAGGQAEPLHFGLGTATKADVRVIWPGGETSDWMELSADAEVHLWRDGPRLALDR